MKKSKKSKGQVTLFAIIGAVILLTAVVVFTMTSSLTKDKPGIKEPEVSLEARPATELIEGCLEQAGKEALVKVGKQGGALTSQPLLAQPSYRGEAVRYSPYVVPFWRYLADCSYPSGCERSEQYPLCDIGSENCLGVLSGDVSIEGQLETYVAEQVQVCVNEFTSLSNVYNLELIDDPVVDVYFGSGKTTFVLSYPTKITSQSTDDIKLVDDYIVDFDIDLLGMYDFAEEIIAFEREYNYYERATMNLITAYASIEGDLPPTGEIDFSLKKERWTAPTVEQILRYDLLPLMGLIQFANTESYERIIQRDDVGEYGLFSQGIYDSLAPKTSNKLYPYSVSHQYLYEPIYFAIDDGSMLIEPSSVGDEVPFLKYAGFAIKDYRFNYHLSYPLLITISDETALQGEGYDFQFGLEVNIRNNVQAYQNFSHLDTSPVIDISLANYEFHLPHNITIATFDALTGEPLEDVVISYVCGDEFMLGQTKQEGAKAVLTTTMPYCEFGGFIKYSKLDYLGESFAFDNTYDLENQYFEFDLWPAKEKEIIIQRRGPQQVEAFSNLGSDTIFAYDNYTENLTANQSVYFTVEKIPTSPYDVPVPLVGFIEYRVAQPPPLNFESSLRAAQDAFEAGYINQSAYETLTAELHQSADMSSDYAVDIPERYTLDFVPGTYQVSAYLIDTTFISIPNETKIIDRGLLRSDEEVFLPALNFTSWPSGGAMFNFTLTPDMVYNNLSLTFYVLEQQLPSNWTMLEAYEDIAEYQEGKERLLEPTLG